MTGTIIAGSRRAVLGALALLLLAIATTVQLVSETRVPDPVSAEAPETRFSAERATRILSGIADRPRDLGSPIHDRVRDELVDRLRALGFDTGIESGLGSAHFESETAFAPVDNVVGTFPGTDPTGRVLLVTHYDSVASGPGAADAGTPVAAILEAVRALLADGVPRNDLVVVFTDGEEEGLLGADAYTREHPAGDNDVVLNWEARGSSGPALLFETSMGNAALVDAYADAGIRTAGDSSAVEAYRYMPNNTDFLRFSEAGYAGLNSANAGDPFWYHSPGDSIAHLDQSTLQHHGENVLGLAGYLGGIDLATTHADDNAVYLHVFGAMVTLSPGVGVAIAGAALVVLVAALTIARRRRLLSLPRYGVAVGSVLAPLILSGALVMPLWSMLTATQPGLAEMDGLVYRSGPGVAAIALLTAALVLAWFLALRRRIGTAALTFGALTWPTVLAVPAAVLTPESATTFSVTALCANLGVGAALLITRAPGAAAAVVAGLVPAAIMLPSMAAGLLNAFGLGLAAGVALPLAMLGVLLAPLWDLVVGPVARRRWGAVLVVGTAAVMALVVGIGGTVLTGFDPEHPRQTYLGYVLDTDSGTAAWYSKEVDISDWTRRFASEPSGEAVPESFVDEQDPPTWSGPAEPMDLVAPTVDAVRDGDTLRLHIESPRGASVVTLAVGSGFTDVTASLPGSDPATEPLAASGGRIRLPAVPDDGIDLALGIDGAADPSLTVWDETVGLEEVPGFVPRPDDLIRVPSRGAETVAVVHRVDY